MKQINYTLTDEVRDVLERSTVDGARLHLPEQLDRKLYLAVAKALELMGGTWDKKQRCHVFRDCENASDVVADAVEAGTVCDLKKTFQFFPSPPDVVAQLIELAELKPGMTVLEPSAGDGAIVRAIPLGRIVDGHEHSVRVYACELQPDKRVKLPDIGAAVLVADFLDLDTALKYDRIIANPPFTRGQDVQHVTKMLEHLKPGGRLVSVMLPTWRFRETEPFTSFRRRLLQADVARHTWDELPLAAFKASGTRVRTGILVVDKAEQP